MDDSQDGHNADSGAGMDDSHLLCGPLHIDGLDQSAPRDAFDVEREPAPSSPTSPGMRSYAKTVSCESFRSVFEAGPRVEDPLTEECAKLEESNLGSFRIGTATADDNDGDDERREDDISARPAGDEASSSGDGPPGSAGDQADGAREGPGGECHGVPVAEAADRRPASTGTGWAAALKGIRCQEQAEADDLHQAEFLELCESSVEAKLLAGRLFSSVTRIRQTINSYTSRLRHAGWFQSFRGPTVRALERRLVTHEKEILGNFHCDLEIGYHQMRRRVQGLLGLHKHLLLWNEAQKFSKLIDILPHLKAPQLYLDTVGEELAPDLQVLVTMACFFNVVESGGSLATAFDVVDAPAMLRWHRAMKEAPTVAVKEEPEEPIESPATQEADDTPTADPSAKKARQRRPATLILAYDIGAAPSHHLNTMLKEGVKHLLFSLPANLEKDQTRLRAVIGQLRDTQARWALMTDGMDGTSFSTEMLEALIVLFCCALPEKERPGTEAARKARQTFFHAVSTTREATAEWYKNMTKYECKSIMQCAQTYVAEGLNDDVVRTSLNSAIEAFETTLGASFFDGPDEWLNSGRDGSAFTIDAFRDILGAAKTFAGAVYSAVDRWSAHTLQSSEGCCTEALELLLVVLSLGVHLSVLEASNVLRDHLARASAKPSDIGRHEDAPRQELPPSSTHAPDSDDGKTVTTSEPVASDSVDHHGRPSMESLNDAAEASDGLCSGLQTFGALLSDVVKMVQSCRNRFSQRLFRTTSFDHAMASLDPMARLITTNGRGIVDMSRYIKECAFLIRAPTFNVLACSRISAGENLYVSSLSMFCQLHQTFIHSEAPLLQVMPTVAQKTTVADELHRVFVGFREAVGGVVYRSHAEKIVQSCVDYLEACDITVNPVHDDALKATRPENMFALLITKPTASELGARHFVCSTQAAQDRATLDTFNYNRTFNILEEFVGKLGLPSLQVRTVRTDGKPTSDMDVQEAMVLLKLKCAARDIGEVSAKVHMQLFAMLADGKEVKHININMLKDDLTNLLAFLHRRLAHMDGLLKDRHVLSIESQGYRLPTSISSLRNWSKSMSLFSKEALRCFLSVFAARLREKIEACRAALPAWDAVFQGDKYNADLANRLLKGRLPSVVQHHNTVHGVMSALVASAKVLNVSPSVSQHELTSQQVVVGQSTLRAAVVASVLCRGVDVLAHAKNGGDRAGSMCRTFLDENQNKHPTVPVNFWVQFEGVCHDAATVPPQAIDPADSSRPASADAGAGPPGKLAPGVGVEHAASSVNKEVKHKSEEPAVGDPSYTTPTKVKRMRRV